MNVLSIINTARISSWSYRIISTIVGMLTIRLINEEIGINSFSAISFYLSFLMGLVAFDFGLLQSTSRFVSKYNSPRYKDERIIFWGSLITSYFFLLLFQLVLLALLSIFISLSGYLNDITPASFICLGLIFILSNILSSISLVYAGLQNYAVLGFVKISKSVFYFIAVLALYIHHSMSVTSILWISAITFLAPNLILFLWVIIFKPNFLAKNIFSSFKVNTIKIKELFVYSAQGWLFTFSNIIISYGTVVIAGLYLPQAEAGKVQIAIALYAGIAAFLTGAMTPITTIYSRFSDDSIESTHKRTNALYAVLNETILLSGILVVFFYNYSYLVLDFLLPQKDVNLLTHTNRNVLILILPTLLTLPFFIFRFTLVSSRLNKVYCIRFFLSTVVIFSFALFLAYLTKKTEIVVIASSVALVLRSMLSYYYSDAKSLRLFSFKIVKFLFATILICGIVNYLLNFIPVSFEYKIFTSTHIHALIYFSVCFTAYALRNYINLFKHLGFNI